MDKGNISIGAPFYYNGPDFLDQRQGIIDTLGGLDTLTELVPDGFEVYVKEQNSWYQKVGAVEGREAYWKKREGLQIYNQEDLDKLTDKEKNYGSYIVIKNRYDDPEEKKFLYKTLDDLLAKVTKLEATFNKGIESYQGTDTYLTRSLGAEKNVEAIEPLWSIDESDLKEDLGNTNLLSGKSFVPISSVTPGSNSLSINASETAKVTWTRDISLVSSSNSRLFAYLTSTSLAFTLGVEKITENPEDPQKKLFIDFDKLESARANLYNICIIISRATLPVSTPDSTPESTPDSTSESIPESTPDSTEESDPQNFIWISIRNAKNNLVLKEGYCYYDEVSKSFKLSSDILKSLDARYSFETITFNKSAVLTKFKMYGQYFYTTPGEFLPSTPEPELDYYKVPHIVIRSVDDIKDFIGEVEVPVDVDETTGDTIYEAITPDKKDSFFPFEPIFDKTTHALYIKNDDNKFYTLSNEGTEGIGGGGLNEETLLEKLQEYGIEVTTVPEQTLKISNVISETFLNPETGISGELKLDSEGNLSLKTLDPNLDSMHTIVNDLLTIPPNDWGYRGFISIINSLRKKIKENPQVSTSDLGLSSDRLKIGSWYAPLETDTVFGCSNAFIELENTSDLDIPLDGLTLRYLKNDKTLDLKLSGIIKKGSTFLIRGKKYSDPKKDANTFINVDTFDQEWIVEGEPIDLTMNESDPFGFLLYYNNERPDAPSTIDPTATTTVWKKNTDGNKSSFPYFWTWWYVDGITINKSYGDTVENCWSAGTTRIAAKSNTIIRNTFELDPAKQAFQSLTTKDSSRSRLANIANDTQYLDLNEEYISFPYSDLTCPISKFSPKSSKQERNVCTDKTEFDLAKPNMVYCNSGIDAYRTKCFNWVSAGSFDEFVWIRIKGMDEAWSCFESYKSSEGDTDSTLEYPKKKVFDKRIQHAVYDRIHRKFPGNDIKYTAHKCIVDLISPETDITTEITYEFVVGRKLIDKRLTEILPDPNHCSEVKEFTLYPPTYSPIFYQTTDQQGFTWIEYQVWSAAAEELEKKIESDHNSFANTFPVILNTGDMTQNGSRINEWLDYYKGGEKLFSKYDHLACVGNNDLCEIDPEILGTGDDSGKSNSFFFHVCFCYEVPNSFPFENERISAEIAPLVKNDNKEFIYIPSLYYVDYYKVRLISVNSEITYVTCDKWYNKHKNKHVINIYTGYETGNKELVEQNYDSEITSIYSMVYSYLNYRGVTEPLVMCHEMPFTVITNSELKNTSDNRKRSRSLNSASSIVGSHLNQLTSADSKSNYWFSRLLEHFGVKLCIGGHKHTYAITFPIREYYTYDNNKNSLLHGKMIMEETLENDDVSFKFEDKNGSRFPILSNGYTENEPDYFTPGTKEKGLKDQNYVTYFMCQATGYKQTSNKELPSIKQTYSKFIPNTSVTDGKDIASDDQKHPMFGRVRVISLPSSTSTGTSTQFQTALYRIKGIMNDSGKFTQDAYGTSKTLQYAHDNSSESPGSKTVSWINVENGNDGPIITT